MKFQKKMLLIASPLLLALGAGIPSQAPAQSSTIAQAEPAIMQEADTSKFENFPSTVTEFNKNSGSAPSHPLIEFKPYNSYEHLLQLFPDAEEIVEKYGKNGQDRIINPQGSFARISEKLYVYWSDKSEDCGSRGCLAVTFSTDENGFYPSANITTAMQPTEYEIDKDGEPSIFTCTADFQLIEWKRRDSMMMTGVASTTENCAPYLAPETPQP